MLNRTLLVAALLASAASPAQLNAQKEVPASLSAFKPHEVVEAVISESKFIVLTADQVARLNSIHVAVRDERHRWTKTPGNKAHRNNRMQPMISQEKAYADALAVLTPAQRSATLERFNDEGYVPVVPSLASKVPASLEGLRPHEIVQAFAAEAGALGLSQSQVEDLGSLHVAVRDEPHRYTMRGGARQSPRAAYDGAHDLQAAGLQRCAVVSDSRSAGAGHQGVHPPELQGCDPK